MTQQSLRTPCDCGEAPCPLCEHGWFRNECAVCVARARIDSLAVEYGYETSETQE